MHMVGDDEPYDELLFRITHFTRYLAIAVHEGIAEIGFTDHVYRFTAARDWIDCDAWRNEATADLGHYVAALDGAREAGFPVLMGLECDWVPGREAEIAALRAAYDWDYFLGSYHWLGEREIDHASNSAWD